MTSIKAFFRVCTLAVLCLIMVMFVTSGATLYSQSATLSSPIHLKSGSFDPLQVSAAGSGTAAQVDAAGLAYYLVQFAGPVEAIWLDQVTALGGHVLGYLPENTHLVQMRPAVASSVASLPTVRWVGPYLPDYKLDPALQVHSAAITPLAEFTLATAPGVDPMTLATTLQNLGITLVEAAFSATGGWVRIQAPLAQVATLAQQPEILWIEPYIPPTLFNEKGRKIIGAEAVWQDLGYFGAGQIVAVSDSGLSVQGALSPDFDGRLVRAFAPSEMNIRADCRAKTTWTDLNGHGTHVAGSVLGNGSRSGSNPANHQYTGSHAGVAPEAQLVFLALNTDGSGSIQCIDLNGDFLARGYQAGARISSNSWGASDRGGYNVLSSLVDDYLWRHQDYLVLYAAGNAGPGAQTVGSPGTAKNALTVGASENNRPDRGERGDDPNTVTDFSSRGPTADGRIKPEIVAPGSWILSVRAAQAPDGSFWDNFNDDYAFMGGTSMATPLTAGGAALVREWLGRARNITSPSGALMKAVLINGATRLPGAAMPNQSSGFGRTDLKNTLTAQYAVIDDYVQGLSTGESVTYTVQVISTTQVGTLATTIASAVPSATVQAASDTISLESSQPLATTHPITDATTLSVEALPGFATRRTTTPIPTRGGRNKEGLTPLVNPTPLRATAALSVTGQSAAGFQPSGARASTTTALQEMVGGGDFEEPEWSETWNEVWLGTGLPLRTDDPDLVVSGEYSVWLGGTPIDDAIWYPLTFPDEINADEGGRIQFTVDIFDQDPGFDLFCVGLVNDSGFFIGPYAGDDPACADEDGLYDYTHEFTPAELADLAGQAGYLVLFNIGDGVEPHLSAIVDDISLTIDFPAVTLTSTPSAGPPGTTFLLTSKYHPPYGWVDICIKPCSDETYIKTVYADDHGNMAAFVYSRDTTPPGAYPIEVVNAAGRSADTVITITGSSQAELSVTPTAGPAGTKFAFRGSGFLPNNNRIAISVNGEALGTTSSNASGEIGFSLTTQSNTPPDTYEVQAKDGACNCAETSFTVTAPGDDVPTLTVTPTAGPPGTTFAFTAQHFTPDTVATVALDGQAIGEITMDESGGVELTLSTTAQIAVGQHTLSITQDDNTASAQFEITSGDDGGGGGDQQSGAGLYVTLVWTDPPAQTAASKTLVNDLDLIVEGPSGRLLGNGGTNPDRTNNVEAIRLEEPAQGTYIITVRAQSVNGAFGAQPFALVATTGQSFGAQGTNVDVSTPNQVGSVSGVLFLDSNRNGQKDADESAIGNARVTATNTQTGFTRSLVSGADGSYRFEGLPVGNYHFAIVPPAPYAPSSFTLQVTSGSNQTNNVSAQVKMFMPAVRR